jgi:hypothetical protein
MKLINKVVISLIFLYPIVHAQPELKITPDKLKFEDVFNRLENAYFINEGDDPLKIDSIVYNNNLYYVRFDNPYSMPVYIEAGDTVKMDCILAGYYHVSSADTADTMYVYSNSIKGLERIRVRIEYWDDDFHKGTINGQVTDSLSSPIPNANIYFFYDGNYIIHTTTTDQNGFYSYDLPAGSYQIAAEKDSFYVTFFGQQFDPFNAEYITLEENSFESADIMMSPEINTSNSVSGIIYDSLSITPLRKGVVVVRNGTHTPTKIVADKNSVTNDIYTAFVSDSGYYKIDNIVGPGYYYVQSFSDYFVPSYYSFNTPSEIFWQNADSVYITSGVNNLNIYMPRDSSLGGGTATGKVNINTGTGEISDIIVYAQAVNNNASIFNYAFPSASGDFNIQFLPYGTYRLIGQKIGYSDGFSSIFTIDSMNTTISDLEVALMPGSSDETPFLPENHVLLSSYPNPFNPSTKIEFFLTYTSEIELKVYNLLGEEVRKLLKENLPPGKYEILFNASGLTSGPYFVILNTNKEIKAKKILLIK